MIKIIGICGSPRKGNNEILLEEALKIAEREGTKTDLIILRERKIEMCDGCLECDKTGKCHFKDDMNNIIIKMKKSDGIIFAAPTYFDDVNGLMKNFLDRLNPIGVKRELKGKKFGIITVGATEPKSFERAIETVKIFGEIELMEFIGSSYGKAYKNDEIVNDKEAIVKAKELGRKLVNVCKMEAK
jgi:multimeric flavodoxin WrbA